MMRPETDDAQCTAYSLDNAPNGRLDWLTKQQSRVYRTSRTAHQKRHADRIKTRLNATNLQLPI